MSYVGHPLADMLPLEDGRDGVRTLHGLSLQAPVFALLPGSRQSELQYMADTFIETALRIHAALPAAVFLVPLATQRFSKLRCIAARRRNCRFACCSGTRIRR